jgi:hypothetical protein
MLNKTIKSLSLTTTLVMGMGALAPEAAEVKPLDHVPAQAYMRHQLSRNDLVLFGTTHKQPPILCLITDLLPELTLLGVTHLALEISSDQQARLGQLC